MRSKNYKAALLKAQMGGKLHKAQFNQQMNKPQMNMTQEQINKLIASGNMSPDWVNRATNNPEQLIQSINTPKVEESRSGWSDMSLPCKGMKCPEFKILDPGTCTCIDTPPVTYPGGRNPDAISTTVGKSLYKKGGQYSPNMNKALKSFKKGGSTKK
tara:strand:- start:1088 stop:1558 length:471 start_codon:yes stop_codon:yes gene_type:complete